MMNREAYDLCCKRADDRMKAKNGHTFEHSLKTRCIFCGRSPKAKGRCRGWFMTFINLLWYEMEDWEKQYGK